MIARPALLALLVCATAAAGDGPSLPLEASLVFDGVTVVDVEQGKLLPDRRVVITGNRIAAVGSASEVKVPKEAQVVNARGKYLIPGLWDMHVHTAAGYFHQILVAYGVTGFRDAWSEIPLDTLQHWRREILAGRRAGPPRQILSGVSINERKQCSSEHSYSKLSTFTCVVSSDTADARPLVESLKAAGIDMLKLYDLSPGMYFRIAAEARRVGIPFGGHLNTRIRATEASDSGAAIIDHAHIGGLYALCGGRNLFPGTGSATVERCRPVAEQFRHHGTWWVPTWVVMLENYKKAFGNRKKFGSSWSNDVYGYLKERSQAFWSDSTSLSLIDSLPSLPDSVRDSVGYMNIAQLADFPILAGTDVGGPELGKMLAGLTLHAELAMLVAEGMTPVAALQAATLNPAKFLHATDSLGTVSPGKLADLVLLDADPLTDITNTTTVRAVVANGRYFDRPALDSLLAKVRAKQP